MRWSVLGVVVVIACHADEVPKLPPMPAPTPVSKPAVVAPPVDAAAAPPVDAAAAPPVELLHALPTTVTVSSTVKNAAILPGHLVDRDFNTAWNAVTGELTPSWTAIALPPGSRSASSRRSPFARPAPCASRSTSWPPAR